MFRRLLLLAALASSLAGCRNGRHRTTWPDAPVVIISIDTVRADHLPLFGYRNVETPNLDGLRRDGILFTAAYAHVPLTLPSHATVMTGLLPQNNAVRNNIGYHLAPSASTLAAMLHDRGYASGAAVSAYVLRGATGLSAGFDSYDDAIESKPGTPVGALQRSGFASEAVAKRWIEANGGKPFFYFLHLFEPHSPYTPPEPFRSKFASPYDGEIATADAITGDFLDFLRKRGIYDRALIIVLSDHGEGLSQHGEPEHGIFLYREAIHVPLIVKLPGGTRAGETVNDPVGLVDILPTVAEVTGATPPARVDGVSLLSGSRSASRRIYSETLYPRIHLGWSDLRSLEDTQFQLIQAPRPELYDIRSDPAETKNVLAEQRRTYASMRDELARYGTEAALPTHVDPEEAKKLTALGYLGSVAAAPSGPLPDPKDRIGDLRAMIEAMTLVRGGRDQEAIDALRKIVAANPRFSDAWNQLALTLEKEGRYGEAADAYKQAITHSPELSGEFGLSLGGVLLKMNRLDEAAAHAKLGEKVNPGGARVLLARVSLARQDFRAAETEAKTAAADPSTATAALVLLGQIYSEQDRPADALEAIRQAEARTAAENGGFVQGLEYVRGDALARMQRYPEALAAFGREIELFPNDTRAYSRAAIVYTLMGDRGRAREIVAQMVRANPNPPAVALAARTLSDLGDQAGAAQWRSAGAKSISSAK